MSRSYKLKQKFEFYEKALLDQCGVNVRELLSNEAVPQERIAHRTAFKPVLEELQKVVQERERKQNVAKIHEEIFPLITRRYDLANWINWDEVEIVLEFIYGEVSDNFNPYDRNFANVKDRIIRMINHGDSRQERRLKKIQDIDNRIKRLSKLAKLFENEKEQAKRLKFELSFTTFD